MGDRYGAGASHCSPCSAGYTCATAGSASPAPVGSACMPGQYSASGSTSCANCTAGYVCPYPASPNATNVTCSAGQYSVSGSVTCTLCPAGLFGASAGMTNATCTAPCTVGHTCSSGTSTPVPCPVGQYVNVTGAVACVNCSAGLYGGSIGLSAASCSGPCGAGYYCPTGSTAAMTKPCVAGYMCPTGTANATSNPCPPGQYSLAAAAVCRICSAGQFGNSSALSTAACSGPCSAGYACIAGTSVATNTACLPGQYSGLGAAACSNCSAGTSNPP